MVHQNCIFTCSTPIQEKRDRLAAMLREAGFQPIIPDSGYFMLAYFKNIGKFHDFNSYLAIFSCDCYYVYVIQKVHMAKTGTETDLQTFRDFLMQYNNVTEQCFGACINDMTSRTVSEKEEKCSSNCLDKFLKMTQRVSLRFQEVKQWRLLAIFTKYLARKPSTNVQLDIGFINFVTETSLEDEDGRGHSLVVDDGQLRAIA
uniref:Zf-Tim10_DDP domain-containing protein n=1 Tax=Heterorhabditis bacteriophora TaxID=37862 RepID=A0A1I7XFQ5_HETBA